MRGGQRVEEEMSPAAGTRILSRGRYLHMAVRSFSAGLSGVGFV